MEIEEVGKEWGSNSTSQLFPQMLAALAFTVLE